MKKSEIYLRSFKVQVKKQKIRSQTKFTKNTKPILHLLEFLNDRSKILIGKVIRILKFTIDIFRSAM